MDVERKQKIKNKISGAAITSICVLLAYIIISIGSPVSEVVASVNENIGNQSESISYLVADMEEAKNTYSSQITAIEQDNLKRTMVNSSKTNQNMATVTYEDGSVYVGETVNGKRSGVGTLTYITGNIYAGMWENDVINGNGKYTFANGNFMEGTFVNNIFVNGVYYFVKPEAVYSVVVANGVLSQQIAVVLTNGDSYTGTLVDGMFNGVCATTYSDGDVFQGEVVNNLKQGTGTYVWKEGAYYVGQWSNDKMHGTGTYYYAGANGPKITGTFVSNKPNGWCTYYATAYKSYSTYWSNGTCSIVQ